MPSTSSSFNPCNILANLEIMKQSQGNVLDPQDTGEPGLEARFAWVLESMCLNCLVSSGQSDLLSEPSSQHHLELVRNANYWFPPQTSWIRNSGVGAQAPVFEQVPQVFGCTCVVPPCSRWESYFSSIIQNQERDKARRQEEGKEGRGKDVLERNKQA